MTLNIRTLRDTEFDALEGPWNALLAQSEADNVFLRWEWIHSWYEVLGKNHHLLLLAAYQDRRLIGIAPLAIDQPQFPRPRCVRFCSDELSPDYMDFIIEKGQELAVTNAFTKELMNRRRDWDLLKLENIRVGSPLLNPHEFSHVPALREEAFHCPYIQIRGHYEDYLKSRHGNSLTYLPKHFRKFFEDPARTHRLIQDEADLEKAMAHVFHLRRIRSESMGLDADFVKGDSMKFHQLLSRRFQKAGILNLEMIYDGNTPVSMGYAFTYKNKVYLFQTAFDPAYKKWSPGGMIIHLMVQRAFTEGREEFDTVKGNEAYKYHWCDHDRVEMALTVYNRNLLGLVYYAGHYVKSFLRGVKNTLRRRPPKPVERAGDGTRQARP